jgi:hypothetical protein
MPYEDHLIKQIERFSQAIAQILARGLNGRGPVPSNSVDTINGFLQNELGLSIQQMTQCTDLELRVLLEKTPFSNDNRDGLIELLVTTYREYPSDEIRSLVVRLIHQTNSIQSSYSLQRLEWLNALNKPLDPNLN